VETAGVETGVADGRDGAEPVWRLGDEQPEVRGAATATAAAVTATAARPDCSRTREYAPDRLTPLLPGNISGHGPTGRKPPDAAMFAPSPRDRARVPASLGDHSQICGRHPSADQKFNQERMASAHAEPPLA
jgi:hypothetical protein